MNFLELCQKVQQKADIPGVSITAVTAQVGILNKVVGWVEDAWHDIQGSQDWWAFLAKPGEVTLTVGLGEYFVTNLLPTDFDYFWEDTIYIYQDGLKKDQLTFIEWEQYTTDYLHEVKQTGIPDVLSISPAGKVHFNKTPDVAYVIKFDYQMSKETLAANLDVPTLPTDFHDVIWRKALVSYGEHYGAPEVYQSASLYLEERLQIMENRYLPKVTFRDNVYAYS